MSYGRTVVYGKTCPYMGIEWTSICPALTTGIIVYNQINIRQMYLTPIWGTVYSYCYLAKWNVKHMGSFTLCIFDIIKKFIRQTIS